MDKMTTIKQNVLKIAYEIAKDCVPFPEKIKICPANTSNSLDGCITESGRVLKNDKKRFSVFIRYGRCCVCMVKFEAETLIPIFVSIGKVKPGKKKNEFKPYKISDIEEIKNYSDKIQTFLRNMLD